MERVVAFYDLIRGEQIARVEGREVRWPYGALWRAGEPFAEPRLEDVLGFERKRIASLGHRLMWIRNPINSAGK